VSDRDASLLDKVVGFYFAYGLFLFLIVLVSPFFLAGAAIVLAVHVYRAWLRSPARLTRLALQKSIDLHERAQQLARQIDCPDSTTFSDNLFRDIADSFENGPPSGSVLIAVLVLAELVYEAEGLTADALPAPPPTRADLREHARYHDRIAEHLQKLSEPDIVERAREAIGQSLIAFVDHLPPMARAAQPDGSDTPQFTVPLAEVGRNVGDMIEAMVRPYYSDRLKQCGLFQQFRRQLDENLLVMSGLTRETAQPSKIRLASDYDGSTDEIIDGYLRYTPFREVFGTELPFSIPQRARMEHWHLVAGSGHGKTQTLQHIILGDLKANDPPALIVIDSQGDMLRKLQRLALFEDSDRLILIDPEDEYSPALNMFDVRNDRLRGYSRSVREQVEAGIIELFNYVFGALASDLTAKQGTAFAYITRLMLSIPGATIHTFRELMETPDASRFREHIDKLDPTARAFFDNQFFNRTAFGETRQQIARRLYTVLQVPAFERMFASPANKLDMFTALQERKVILINTSKALLKNDASALFGRYMIALTLNAAFERVAVPESQRPPAYLIIDEAAEYFDATLERLLAQARKFRLGVLFAHQHMDQLSPTLRSAVAANTSIKMAGGVSDHDARQLAPDMRTSPDFIAATRKQASSTEFACYVRNLTDTAVRIRVPFGAVEDAAVMSAASHRWLLERNRERYGVDPDALVDSHSPAAGSMPDPPPRRRDPEAVDMRPTNI